MSKKSDIQRMTKILRTDSWHSNVQHSLIYNPVAAAFVSKSLCPLTSCYSDSEEDRGILGRGGEGKQENKGRDFEVDTTPPTGTGE